MSLRQHKISTNTLFIHTPNVLKTEERKNAEEYEEKNHKYSTKSNNKKN